jgi:hypothetical protein
MLFRSPERDRFHFVARLRGLPTCRLFCCAGPAISMRSALLAGDPEISAFSRTLFTVPAQSGAKKPARKKSASKKAGKEADKNGKNGIGKSNGG